MLWKGVGLYHMSSICSRFDHTDLSSKFDINVGTYGGENDL